MVMIADAKGGTTVKDALGRPVYVLTQEEAELAGYYGRFVNPADKLEDGRRVVKNPDFWVDGLSADCENWKGEK